MEVGGEGLVELLYVAAGAIKCRVGMLSTRDRLLVFVWPFKTIHSTTQVRQLRVAMREADEMPAIDWTHCSDQVSIYDMKRDCVWSNGDFLAICRRAQRSI